MCSATTLSLSLFLAAAQREKERYLLYTRVQSGVEEEEGGGGGRRRGLAQRGIMMQRWRGRGTLELAGALAIGRGKPLLPRSPCWYYNDRAQGRERERAQADCIRCILKDMYIYTHSHASTQQSRDLNSLRCFSFLLRTARGCRSRGILRSARSRPTSKVSFATFPAYITEVHLVSFQLLVDVGRYAGSTVWRVY